MFHPDCPADEPALDCSPDEPDHQPSHGGGPRTEGGKARSSMNALKTGLTGRTVLLPTDDVAAYEQHLQQFNEDWKPFGPRETKLVQMLADHEWRLMRIADMEMSLYASGAHDFADSFDHQPPEMRPHLIRVKTFIHHERHLRNLHIQEMRIRRHAEKDTALLMQLQRERLGEGNESGHGDGEELVITNRDTGEIIKVVSARDRKPPFTRASATNEFVFSTSDVDRPERHPIGYPSAA